MTLDIYVLRGRSCDVRGLYAVLCSNQVTRNRRTRQNSKNMIYDCGTLDISVRIIYLDLTLMKLSACTYLGKDSIW
jgi:hypothetical protein